MSILDVFKRITGIKSGNNNKSLSSVLTTPIEKPTTSMSEIVVRALIPVTRENWLHVKELGKKRIWLANDPHLDAILEGFDPDAQGSYIRCDSPASPILVNENKARVQLWTRRGMTVDADHMVMIQSTVLQAPDRKVISFRPQIVVRGKSAPFIMLYRMSCCGESSYSALISIGDKSGKNFSNVLDSNPEGIKAGMGSGIFYNAATNTYNVRVAGEQEAHMLSTIYDHIERTKQQIPSIPPRENKPQ